MTLSPQFSKFQSNQGNKVKAPLRKGKIHG